MAWITTPSAALARLIEAHGGTPPIELKKVNGETRLANRGLLGDHPD